MRREPVPATSRKAMTPKRRLEALLANNGRCSRCGGKISGNDFEVDHRVELFIAGKEEVGNLETLHRKCHADKTKKRAPVLAKVRRLIRDDDPETRRKSPRPLKGGKPLQSRGFDKSKTRGFDGKARAKTRPAAAERDV